MRRLKKRDKVSHCNVFVWCNVRAQRHGVIIHMALLKRIHTPDVIESMRIERPVVKVTSAELGQ